MKSIFIISFFCLLCFQINAQGLEKLPPLQPADSLNTARFWTAVGGGTLIYTGTSIVLWNTWYKQYETTSFHLFNDWEEWEGIDKAGHLMTAYHEARWSFNAGLWTGMDRRKAMWTGLGIGMGLQATIEVMDGFAEKWGFSLGDIGFNTIGVSLFAAQELLWEEQRIIPKMSFNTPKYSDDSFLSVDGMIMSSAQERAADLYGGPFIQRFFKDYNGHTYWLSINPASFLQNADTWIPAWLNIAAGYGAQNMFGGFRNAWPEEDPIFIMDPGIYPRYQQFYLSFDVDLTKIKTENRLLKMVFSIVNFIKIPAPALEFNTLGEVHFHPIFW